MLLRLVLVVTVAALVLGVVVVVALSRRDTSAREHTARRLTVADRQLRVAREVLRRIANNTSANPGIDASLALDEMDTLDTQELPR